jgi:signal transduction histidine kinase
LLTYLDEGVRIVVIDDGKGFDADTARPSMQGGFGVPGIRERAHAMHASLRIARESGRGTRLEISVPHV